MARTGYAKGVASGHVTTERPKKVKPSHRKGVRYCFTILSLLAIIFSAVE
jgi:hypothetical protein